MPLSLQQFDERVIRANKSMDRLDSLVDSREERQALNEMRREISALFAEQRKDLERLQDRPADDHIDTADAKPAKGTRARSAAPAAKIDPAIELQQQAIAAGRALRAEKQQVAAQNAVRAAQRDQATQDAEQRREEGKDRDGAER